MPREMRYRTAGILFYLVVILNLALTQQGQNLVSALFASATPSPSPTQTVSPLPTPSSSPAPMPTCSPSTNSDAGKLWMAAFTAGVAAFTSDAVGFALSALFFCIWQLRGGYSALWKKNLSYNPKDFILTEYRKSYRGAPDEASLHRRFEERWDSYSLEVFLSYVWQYAPKRLDEWHSRRLTVFFAYWSSILGVVLGFVVSFTLSCAFHLCLTPVHMWIALIATFFVGLFCFNAWQVKKDVRQIVDLCVAGLLNPGLRMTMEGIKDGSVNDAGTGGDEASE